MAPLKSFLLVSSGIAAALTCSNDNCEAGDQTALLQSHLTRKSDLALSSTGAAFFPKLGNLNDPATRKSALLEIQKTAVKLASMDASEATPVVIEVCTDTAQMLNETVLYAIMQEDAVDRAELVSAYGQFAQHEDNRLAIQAALDTALDLVTTTEQTLIDCRTEEESKCVIVDDCTIVEHPPCVNCEQCHNCEIPDSLCQIDREIQERWCESSTEPERMADTDAGLSWRVATKTLFTRYQTQVDHCTQSCSDCTGNETQCETAVTEYLTVAHDCNQAYTEWESAKCAQYQAFDGAVQVYRQGFLATLAAYNDVVARVMIEEADRKVEWEVLTRVICLLLTLTNTEDGAAASADNSALIQRCWDEDVDTSHLDIDYRDPPPMGDVTAPELPCAGPFIDPIYGVDIVNVPGKKPPSVCENQIVDHNTKLDRESCSCAHQVEIPALAFQLGDFLLIDPSVEVIGTQASESQWTAEIWGSNNGGGFREPVLTLDGSVATDNQYGYPHDGPVLFLSGDLCQDDTLIGRNAGSFDGCQDQCAEGSDCHFFCYHQDGWCNTFSSCTTSQNPQGRTAEYNCWEPPSAVLFGIHDGTPDAATSMVGSMSTPHAGALPDVTSDFFSEEEQAANSVIAFVSWAYGTSQAFPEDTFTLEERFAQRGGFMYMNSAREVIAVRELAASSSDLNQAATSFMSFDLSKDITAAEFTDTCGPGHEVSNSQHRYLGAEKYCWTQGALSGAGWSCTNGCFVYQTSSGHVAFPRS